MRFRTLVLWVVLLVVLAWVGYTIVAAGSSYLQASGIVDQAVSDAVARRKAQVGAGMSPEASRDFIENVRIALSAGAKARGFALDPEGGITLSQAAEGVRVIVRWSFPVTVYDGPVIFNIPMSITRVYSAT